MAAVALVTTTGWTVAARDAAEPDGPSRPAHRPAAVASIEADGTIAGTVTGVSVHRRDQRRYELTLAEPSRLTVRAWSSPATVTVTPATSTQWVITFVERDEPVDVDFTVLAEVME